MAEDYKNFEDMRNRMFSLRQPIKKIRDIKPGNYFQQELYNHVNSTLKANDVFKRNDGTLKENDDLRPLDKLSDGRIRSKLVVGNG